MSTGSRLATARRAVNLTQEQVAQRLGVSRWESDAAYPETEKIIRLARLFGVTCDWILRDEVTAAAAQPPEPVTRLLQQALGRRVQLQLYGDDFSLPPSDWCVIRESDGQWARVECVRTKKNLRTSHLIPVSALCSIPFLPEEGPA